MADDTQTQAAADLSGQAQNGPDPKFFDCVNEYLELTNKQSREYGEKRISLASMYAAARFNAHVYLVSVKPIHAASERGQFLDYMTTMYRRMLNEHLDGMGQERGIDVGESELAAEYAAAGIQVGGATVQTPAGDYVAAAGAVPPAAPANE
jgi:hypothetical protein